MHLTCCKIIDFKINWICFSLQKAFPCCFYFTSIRLTKSNSVVRAEQLDRNLEDVKYLFSLSGIPQWMRGYMLVNGYLLIYWWTNTSCPDTVMFIQYSNCSVMFSNYVIPAPGHAVKILIKRLYIVKIGKGLCRHFHGLSCTYGWPRTISKFVLFHNN